MVFGKCCVFYFAEDLHSTIAGGQLQGDVVTGPQVVSENKRGFIVKNRTELPRRISEGMAGASPHRAPDTQP
jgi:hypothetical protein